MAASLSRHAVPLVPIAMCLTLIYAAPAQAQDDDVDIDSLFELSLDELVETPIASASMFDETSLTTGSTVSVITSSYWEERGARRLNDALSYMPAFAPLPNFLGVKQYGIRGFVSSNGSGVQTLWDGVPINTFPVGTAQLDHQNIQLKTLDKIEVIRGPGSALYGADAFHGVVSLAAYESEQNEQQVSIRGATNKYYDGSYRGSYSLGQSWRLNLAVAANGQSDQNFEYQYYDGGDIATAERDYRDKGYTTSVKLSSNPANKTVYKLGLYYNDYSHDNYFFDGASVPSNDTSDINSHLGIIKGEIRWSLGSVSDITLTSSYWTEAHDFHRILSPANNQINIIVDEETQSLTNLIYRNNDIFDNTKLSLGLSHRVNRTKNAYRTVNTATGNVVLNAPLPFTNQSREINAFLMDGTSSFADDKYILRYGFRVPDRGSVNPPPLGGG